MQVSIPNRFQIASGTGNADGDNTTGGFVGYQKLDIYDETVEIESCYCTGSVNSWENAGGFAGAVINWEYNDSPELIQSYGIIQHSYSLGITSGNINGGGFVGIIGNKGIISKCYCTGSAGGEDTVGGFAGLQCYFGTLNKCYSPGETRGFPGLPIMMDS